MPTSRNTFPDIDAYIASLPEEIQQILQDLRAAIHQAAPGAEEAISYAIPTFRLHGNLVHFAAFKNHIGFYPGPSGIKEFQDELSAYKGARGSVQFPIGQPLPWELITRIVRFRAAENRELAEGKPAARRKTGG